MMKGRHTTLIPFHHVRADEACRSVVVHIDGSLDVRTRVAVALPTRKSPAADVDVKKTDATEPMTTMEVLLG